MRTRCAASTATWCWCAASTPRASPSSARASSACGRPARARRPRRSAPPARSAADDFVFPSYREIGVNFVRGASRLGLRPRLARRGALDVQPVRHQHGDAADHHRRAGAARGRLRDGHPARRHRPGRRRLLRRRRDEPGRRERGDGVRVLVPRPGRLRVHATTSGRSPSRSPCRRSSRSPAARRASASRACGSTATTSSRASPRCAGRSTTRARGNGPAFIEAVTYRMGPHTTSDDPTRYRDKDEVERWRRRDPLARVEALLRAQGAFSDDFAARGRRRGRPLGRRRARRHACGAHEREPIEVFDHVYAEPHSGSRRSARSSPPTSTASPTTPSEAVRDDAAHDGEGHQRRTPSRDGRRPEGRSSWARTSASSAASSASPTGCSTSSAPQRVIDTPLAESGIMGTAVGLAFRGYRPVVEIQFDGFVYPAFDQIVCQVAKLHYRTRGNVKMPITIRIPWAGGVGAAEHHSESPEAYFVHTSGLRVVAVSNPQDAYVMLRQAIASNDPVVYFEPKRLYHTKGEVDLDVDLADAPPMGLARVAREGTRRHAAHLRRAGDRRRWMPRPPPRTRASRSRSSTCARSRPSTTARSTASVRKTGRVVVDARGRARGGRRRRADRERHRAVLQLPRGGAACA